MQLLPSILLIQIFRSPEGVFPPPYVFPVFSYGPCLSVWLFFLLAALGLHYGAGLLVLCSADLEYVDSTYNTGLSCSVAWGILVSQPGMEPMSPTLEGRTTGSPGKSASIAICNLILEYKNYLEKTVTPVNVLFLWKGHTFSC